MPAAMLSSMAKARSEAPGKVAGVVGWQEANSKHGGRP